MRINVRASAPPLVHVEHRRLELQPLHQLAELGLNDFEVGLGVLEEITEILFLPVEVPNLQLLRVH